MKKKHFTPEPIALDRANLRANRSGNKEEISPQRSQRHAEEE